MASDRGSATELEPDELDPVWFRCDRLHLSGYALLVEPVADAALRAAELGRAEGASISVDLSAWSLIDDAFRERVRRCEPETVLATEAERDTFGPLDVAWVVKRGPDGVNVAGVDHPALPTEILDPTGARRRGRGRFPHRRRGARPRGRRPLLRKARRHAVIRLSEEVRGGARGRRPRRRRSRPHSSRTVFSAPGRGSRSGSPRSKRSEPAAPCRPLSAFSKASSSSG